MVRSLTLLRHGRTAYNAEGRFQGQVDVPLDDLGEAQARAVAVHLAGSSTVSRIVASDLRRAAQTAQALSDEAGVAVEFDSALREISVGDWEGHTRDEIAQMWPDELDAWLAGVDMRPPGGESRDESATRVHGAITRLVDESDEDSDLVIVAHGAVIRGATEMLLGMERGDGRLGVLTNCTYAKLSPGRDGWVLRTWGGGAESVALARPGEDAEVVAAR
ncbi:histidine phosphatase family protein [Brevibacterium yomogidense]|uniref:Phosphoglycerate mutase family n=1 Tax=Brevibacterium yomogidense TaxID=946573 RepID=A0A1X6XCV4_9MICO|nr:histidine phosphatase family protein [Brevibacterium yomogidense]SLM96407.1 Phosphoglycerate mutase family [Brevibacterium yomogidense]